MLQVYNTLSQQKEKFEPIEAGKVRMYVCGPTVYDYLHVGNFRGAIFFNAVRNWLEKIGYKVTYVYNYTDVDDRILERAKKEGVAPSEISEKYIKAFQEDYERMNLHKQDHNPKVTEFIPPIISFIQELEKKEKAYVIPGDGVYYSIKSFPDYGKLSHKKMEDIEAGFRIEVNSKKKHPADFALWKMAKSGEPLSWPSPWGEGRPGWHIECSAMIRSILGDSIDIHGGGIDLVPTHHENEIAQSEGCTGKHFVKYWMHNNMIEFGAQKMSKSIGNTVKGRDFISQYNAEILKFMVLSSHYRRIMDLSEKQIHNSISALARIYSALALSEKIVKEHDPKMIPLPDAFQKVMEEQEQKFIDAMNDDFNTPEVMAAIFEVVRAFNNTVRRPGKVTAEMREVANVFSLWLRNKGDILALFQESAGEFLLTLDNMLLEQKNLKREHIDELVNQRNQARASKDFAKSDQLRDQLKSMGIALQDTPQGSFWEVEK